MDRLAGGLIKFGLAALFAGAAAGCGGAPDRDETEALDILAEGEVQCVPIPEGLYRFDGAQFAFVSGADGLDAPGASAEPPPTPRPASGNAAEAAVEALDLSWLTLDLRDGVATLTGLAPSAESKALAVERATQALRSTPDGARLVIVDGVSVLGGARASAEAVAELGARPSLEACQAAFDTLKNGRRLYFETDSGAVAARSEPLADALSGAAILCRAYKLEVGAHTDTRGDPVFNRELSQKRAEALKDYMVARGAPEARLTAVGYGASRPLSDGDSFADHDRNRRVEFKLSER